MQKWVKKMVWLNNIFRLNKKDLINKSYKPNKNNVINTIPPIDISLGLNKDL